MNQPSEEVRMMAAEVERLFCENFNYYMKLKDRSQVDIAKALGVTEATVSYWSTGKRLPRMNMIAKIASWLGVESHALITERNQEGFYINDDVKRIANEIAKNSDLMLLFKTAKHAGPGGVKIATDMLEALRRKEEGDDDGDFDQVRHLEDAER